MSLAAPLSDRRRRTDRRRGVPHPLAAPLADAIAADAMEIVFQPQYRCADDALVGAEALVRWQGPDESELAGDELFAIAADAGLEMALSAHVFEAAMRLAHDWPGELVLSLNVTAANLADAGFADSILALLQRTAFPPARLTLEITEQVLVSDLERSALVLAELVAKGVRVALDDFGAGFCNFGYLKMLPLYAIKLDRSMVDGIARDERDLAVLRGIVSMADALGLAVIAEGVERAEQRAIVAREGCATWQGFLGAKPLATADFAVLAAG